MKGEIMFGFFLKLLNKFNYADRKLPPNLSIEQLQEKYMERIQPNDMTVNQMITFIEETFSAKHIVPEEISYLVFNIEKEMCEYFVEENKLEVDHFSFEAFEIKEDDASKAFYDVMRQNDEWTSEDVIVILIEKEIFYMNTNCSELFDFLHLKKGISKKDYIEKNVNLMAYLRLIQDVEWFYSEQELELFKMRDLLPMHK